MSDYQHVKLSIVNNLGLAKDGLHIYVGVLAFFASVLILRRSARSFAALIPVLAVALFAEAADLRDGAPWAASLHDVWNTMLIPLALVLLARRRAFCDQSCGVWPPASQRSNTSL